MTFELHVWGPAFSLPSIDPECIALIAYFSRVVPQGHWTLVASTSALVPTKVLPSLRAGSIWLSGFESILDHLQQHSPESWDIDNDLPLEARASSTAFRAFLQSIGRPLLDLSLYVSSENYHEATRSAYSGIISAPLRYVIPSRLRAAARHRSAHLGLSSLDVDNNDDKSEDDDSFHTNVIPRSLRKASKDTVTSLLGRPELAGRVRLDALSVEFLEPLARLLSEKRYLLSDSKPSSLDFLTFGYLSLSLIPNLPQSWLADTMREKYPTLCNYVNRFQSSFVTGPFHPANALVGTDKDQTPNADEVKGRTNLPWSAPADGGMFQWSEVLFESLVGSLPVLGAVRQGLYRHAGIKDEGMERGQLAAVSCLPQSRLSRTATVTASLSACITCLFYLGLIPFPHRQQPARTSRLSDFGDAGAALAALS